MKSGATFKAIIAPFAFISQICCILLALSATPGWAAVVPTPQTAPTEFPSGTFSTPLSDGNIDDASLAEWVGGAAHPLANPTLLTNLIWTRNSATHYGTLKYGVTNQPGPRHLRVGFHSAISVGEVLVRGDGVLSVLRPEAPYPGNLADDSQWIPAKRLVKGQLSTADVDLDSYALWILPPGTKTRALRFSHVAAVTDSNFGAVFEGAYLLSDRFVNLAPEATVLASNNEPVANYVNDEKYNNHPWDNGPAWHKPVSSSDPAWVILTWAHPVTLRGLATMWTGFDAADVETLTGPDTIRPLDAPESSWQRVGKSWDIPSQYPNALGIDWLDFGKTISTRAIRLRMTKCTDEHHNPNLVGQTKDGARVWLGEVLALAPLGADDPVKMAASASSVPVVPHPPIPVQFTLDSPAFVTLVIEDAKGNRVRNLISDTWFEAGPNTVWWDGSDDLGRDNDAAKHGVYNIPPHYVAEGRYEVRGLTHKAVNLHYEFSVYNSGHPAWETLDMKGGWLTNHTPPSAALYVPADKAPGGRPMVYLGSFVSEGGAGLSWVDLDGNRLGGRNWIGGNWTGGPFLARDEGPKATQGIFTYVGAAWNDGGHSDPTHPSGAIRLTALTSSGDKPILNTAYTLEKTYSFDRNHNSYWREDLGGLAVYNNLAVISVTTHNQLLFVDTVHGKLLGTVDLKNPRGLAFDAEGHLLVLAGQQVLRYPAMPAAGQLNPASLAAPSPFISLGLDEPTGIALDSTGEIFISDRGNSHQVKVFSDAGKFLRAIGHPGKPHAGPYDQLHMNNPRGLTIDEQNHLWVAEEDYQPRRVSVWTLDGKLVKGFYGPAEYGGGGALDPQDKTRFYYHGMQFKLDWTTGRDTLDSIIFRPADDDPMAAIQRYPLTALYHGGHRYFTSCYAAHETDGAKIGVVFLDGGAEAKGVARQVAAIGSANSWPLLKDPAFKSSWPAGTDPNSTKPEDAVLFSWSDTNGNGKPDPGEVVFQKAVSGWVTVMPDLTIVVADVNGKVMRYNPLSFSAEGIPAYDLRKGEVQVDGAQMQAADGGGQVLLAPQATVMTTAPLPFPPQAVGGVDSQGHRWSYPSLWPGLWPGHSAPIADHPGEVIGETHLLGGLFSPPGSDAGPLWAVNGNLGDVYVFTADGLFVTQLFQDIRTGKSWNMPISQRNMLLNDVSLHEEDFYPSITQTQDGKIYVVDGNRTSIVRVDGLESATRLKAPPITVTKEELQKAQGMQQQAEATRQDFIGAKSIKVAMLSSAPQLDSLFGSSSASNWVTVDRRIYSFGRSQAPEVLDASVFVAGGRLFAVYRGTDAKLLVNSGAVENAPFKTGGALDLMIGANPKADPKRGGPAEGDVRLLVYLVNGKPRATLYRGVVPGTKVPVPFSSPSRTITLDKVEDVTSQVEFAANAGDYAFSIPLSVLGLKPVAGEKIKGDIGVLRGDGMSTVQRVYWNNKATGIVSDVPSEAQLTPNLWGDWTF